MITKRGGKGRIDRSSFKKIPEGKQKNSKKKIITKIKKKSPIKKIVKRKHDYKPRRISLIEKIQLSVMKRKKIAHGKVKKHKKKRKLKKFSKRKHRKEIKPGKRIKRKIITSQKRKIKNKIKSKILKKKVEKANKKQQNKKLSKLRIIKGRTLFKKKIIHKVKSVVKKVVNKKVKTTKFHTSIDQVYDMVNNRGKVSIRQIMKRFKVKKTVAEEWAKILEDHGLIEISYPTFGSPRLKKPKPIVEDESE